MKRFISALLACMVLFCAAGIAQAAGSGESTNTKEDFYRQFMEAQAQKSPSEQFVSGSVFDISRRYREEFMQAVRAEDALTLLILFANAYALFMDHPEVVFISPAMISKDNNDTDPAEWNADIFPLPSGDYAALLFMPVQDETLSARIVGIIFSDRGDGYYYCMLNKDQDVSSRVYRNRALQGIVPVGQVKGLGFDLMNDFLACIQKDFDLSR